MASTSSLDADLHEKFSTAEDDFIDATFDGPSATSAYITRFAALTQTATHGIANRLLSGRTIELMRCVASNVMTLANNLRELDPRTKAVEARREAELVELLSRFSLRDRESDIQPQISRSVEEKSGADTDKQAQLSSALSRTSSEETLVGDEQNRTKLTNPTAHISMCYDWLLKNPYNPYPTHNVKKEIAKSSGTQLKTVDSWFATMRRRIGWTAISKQHFRGARVLTIDYADRVLNGRDRDGSVPDEIKTAFHCMKAELKKVYDAELGTSNVISRVEEMIRTEEATATVTKALPSLKKRRRAETTEPSEPLNTTSGRVSNLDHAGNVKKSTLSTDSSTETNTIVSQVVSTSAHTLKNGPSRKRRISDDDGARDSKRRRSTTNRHADRMPDTDRVKCSQSSPPSRKRRASFSESDDGVAPKRLRVCPSVSSVTKEPENSAASCPNDSAMTSNCVDEVHSRLGEVDGARAVVEVYETCDDLTSAPLNEQLCNWPDLLSLDSNLPTVGTQEDPLAMLLAGDTGSGFLDFPALPDFNVDWWEIPAPSIDPLFLPSDPLTMMMSMPANCTVSDVCSPAGSESTLVEPSELDLSFLNKSFIPSEGFETGPVLASTT